MAAQLLYIQLNRRFAWKFAGGCLLFIALFMVEYKVPTWWLCALHVFEKELSKHFKIICLKYKYKHYNCEVLTSTINHFKKRLK